MQRKPVPSVQRQHMQQESPGTGKRLYLRKISGMAGKEKKTTLRVPVIDLKGCSDCGTCLELCPWIFIKNRETDIIEIAHLPEYPEKEIQAVISMCPCDCISWEDDS